MQPLSIEQWNTHWEWCRSFIDCEAIYRADKDHPPIPSKKHGGTYVWQLYLRRATQNPEFAYRLSLLFWDHFYSIYQSKPFQIGACHPSGVPIGNAVAGWGYEFGIPVNLFLIRREMKGHGVDNFFDGVVNKLPVLLIDDIAASTEYLAQAAARVQVKLGLPLHQNYFTVVNKVGYRLSKEAQHTENYLENQLISLFTMNNLTTSADDFKHKYGQRTWTGLVA